MKTASLEHTFSTPDMRIIIVRHGQTDTTEYLQNDPDYPKADPPLSDLGKQQAYYTALELKKLNFSGRIYSSPFTRTLETAQPAAELLSLPVFPAAAFREIVMSPKALEDFPGMPLTALREKFPMLAENAELPFPWWTSKLESAKDVEARVFPFVESLLKNKENVLLFGHGASTGAAVRYLMQKSGLAFNDFMNAPDNCNCAISIFDITGNKVTPIRVYGHDHLPLSMVTSNPRYAMNPNRSWYPYGKDNRNMEILVRAECPETVEENYQKGRFVTVLPERFTGTLEFRINDRFIGDTYGPGPTQKTNARIVANGLTAPVQIRLIKAGTPVFEVPLSQAECEIHLPLYRGELPDCPVWVEVLDVDGTLLAQTNIIRLTEG